MHDEIATGTTSAPCAECGAKQHDPPHDDGVGHSGSTERVAL
jgi:hypothetical protein